MVEIETLVSVELPAGQGRPVMRRLADAVLPYSIAGAIPGAVTLAIEGVTVLDASYDTNVYLWWPSYLHAIQELAGVAAGQTEFMFPDQPLVVCLRRDGGSVTVSLDYFNSRTRRHVQIEATGSFDELARASFDAAERFHRRIIELDPSTAGLNRARLQQLVLTPRVEMGFA